MLMTFSNMKRPLHQRGLGPILEVLFSSFWMVMGLLRIFLAPFFGGLNLLGSFSLIKKKKKSSTNKEPEVCDKLGKSAQLTSTNPSGQPE